MGVLWIDPLKRNATQVDPVVEGAALRLGAPLVRVALGLI
jgi:hypothetical protein